MSETIHAFAIVPQACPGGFFQEHRDEVLAAMARVLDSGWYILGREVEAFEEEFARHFGYGGAVGVGNGTDAVALALRSVGVVCGDRVATVSHTAVATVAAIEMIGATPVFVDISESTYTMDPESLARTLEAIKPIRAIVVVHLYGHPADLTGILPIAKRFGVSVIEDCAQAHGAMLDGHYVGSMGDAATFSFYPTKNLGALGDCGMVVSSDPDCLNRVRALRQYGWERRYISEVPGVNSRLDELQAAILRARLPHLDAANERRATISSLYNEAFKETELILPHKRAGSRHVYHQYVVRHSDRDRFQARLKQKGVGTNIHYPVPVHGQPAYARHIEADPEGLRTTDLVATEILSLPIYPELSDSAVAEIVDIVCSSV